MSDVKDALAAKQQQIQQLRKSYQDLLIKYERIKKNLREKVDRGIIVQQLYQEIVQEQIKEQSHSEIVQKQKVNIQNLLTSDSERKKMVDDFCNQEFQLPNNQNEKQKDLKIQQVHPEYKSKQSNNIQGDNFENILVDLRKSNKSKQSSFSEKSFEVIQGAFILQKKKIPKDKSSKINILLQMVEFAYPQDILKNQKQILEMVIRYVYGSDPTIEKIEDDIYNSRKNEIVFGTPYDDYSFAFQDHKWNTKKQLPDILKDMGAPKKKYVYILVRPQLVEEGVQKNQVKIQKENNSCQDNEQKEYEQFFDQVTKDEGKDYRPFQRFFDRTSKQFSRQKSQSSVKSDQSQASDTIPQQGQEEQQKGQTFYETQTIYGFISAFPLRVFFQDLHRTIQQQVKFAQFNENTPGRKKQQKRQNQQQQKITRFKKYETIGKIMKKLIDEKYEVKQFPIHHEFVTGIVKLELSIPSAQSFYAVQYQFMKQVIQKYHFSKINKLIHSVLGQKFVMIEAPSRKILNQIMELIRIMIKPFFWLFAVVYVYSDYFEPFLSSPMPIIIGKLTNSEGKKQIESLNSLDCSDFQIIQMNKQQLKIKDKQVFKKAMKELKKFSQGKYKDNHVQLVYRYVATLKNFIQKGILDIEPTDFHIEFIDTQMVSYYKDLHDGRNSAW